MIGKLQYISQESVGKTHVENILEACKAGVSWVQLRVKNKPIDEVEAIAIEAKRVCEMFKAKIIMNDHVDLALKLNFDGVHVGKNDMPSKEAREILGKNKIVGGTANTMDEVREHVANGVDYVGVGPFRFTSTKDNLSPILGLTGYHDLMVQCQKDGIDIPVIAIGGIKNEDITAIQRQGTHGIAVASLITDATDKDKIVKEIYKNLGIC